MAPLGGRADADAESRSRGALRTEGASEVARARPPGGCPGMARVLLVLVLAGAAQDPKLTRQIEGILDQHYGSFPKERRPEFARRIASAIGQAPPERVPKLIEALPQLSGYSESVLSFYGRQADGSKALEELLAGGHGIFADQMEVIVNRAARREESDAQRSAVEAQIGRIFASGREFLKDRLAGEAAARFIDGEMLGLEKGWKETLDRPFNAVMDAPLTPSNLDRVIHEMRIAAQSFDRVVIEEKDFGDPKRLAALGVPQLVAKVREAAYLATRLCFPDRALSVQRERLWIKEFEALRDQERRRTEPSAPAPETPSPARADAYSPEDLRIDHGMEREAAERRRPPSATGKQGDPPGSRLFAWVGVAGLLALLIWLFARFRGR
ncbi:MAG: hypothetical protein HY293_14795 [Planctomycetes bacterium]|nr:hypothetical protein [Planctomycetota bacterium]